MAKKINVEELPDFDLAEHLKTDEDIATYLSIVLEGDDSSELMRALGVVARARGMTEVARAAGLTREALYKALRPGAQAQHAGAGSCLIVPGLRRTRRSSGRQKTAPLNSTFSAEIPPTPPTSDWTHPCSTESKASELKSQQLPATPRRESQVHSRAARKL